VAHELHNPDDELTLPRGYTTIAPGAAHQLWLPRGLNVDTPATPTPGDQPAGTAASYVISGAGTAACNGTVTYYASSSLFGGTIHIWVDDADTPTVMLWRLDDQEDTILGWVIYRLDGASWLQAYAAGGSHTTPPASGWTVESDGTAPAPTVAPAT